MNELTWQQQTSLGVPEEQFLLGATLCMAQSASEIYR